MIVDDVIEHEDGSATLVVRFEAEEVRLLLENKLQELFKEMIMTEDDGMTSTQECTEERASYEAELQRVKLWADYHGVDYKEIIKWNMGEPFDD